MHFYKCLQVKGEKSNQRNRDSQGDEERKRETDRQTNRGRSDGYMDGTHGADLHSQGRRKVTRLAGHAAGRMELGKGMSEGGGGRTKE